MSAPPIPKRKMVGRPPWGRVPVSNLRRLAGNPACNQQMENAHKQKLHCSHWWLLCQDAHARKSCRNYWKKVDAALGKTPRCGRRPRMVARSDLQFSRRRSQLNHPRPWRMGCIRPMHGEAMVMADLVLLETEITPVMTKLLGWRPRHHGNSQSCFVRHREF